jgi:tetratricopeptide (TPR) repeat protein
LAAQRQAYGDHHPRTAQGKLLLSQLLVERGELAEAEQLLGEVLDFYADRPDRAGPVCASALRFHAAVLGASGRAAEAEAALRESLELQLALYPPTDLRVVDLRDAYRDFLTRQGRYEEAERGLLEAWSAIQATPNAPRGATARVGGQLVALYQAWSRPEEAEKYRQP